MPAETCELQEARACGTQSTAESGCAIVLLVDDDPVCRRLTVGILKQAGYAVRVAEDGERAITMLRSVMPDLILLERDMPGMDGLEVCRRVKADARLSDLPVVFLSAVSAPGACVAGFDAGGIDSVSKPIVREELLARLRAHVDLARSRQRLRQRVMQLTDRIEEQQSRLGQVRDGQESLLTDPAKFPDLKLAVRFQPVREAGGDFYEIARLSEDVFAFFVADVSGHDLSSTYITGALKALTATFTNECLTAHETMVMLNAGLFKFLDETQYVTASYAKFDRSIMEVELICAGHPAPLSLPEGGNPEFLDIIGDPLGMCEQAHFETRRLAARPGDRLMLYTDGLIESFPDAAGRLGNRAVGMERIARSLADRGSVPITEAVDATVRELLKSCACSLEDDIVLIGVEF